MNPLPPNYEPPLAVEGSELIPGKEPVIAPGVQGYVILHEDLIYIPWIAAMKEGNGSVGRFLDSLSPRCRIVNVISPRLQGMLERRGFICAVNQENGIDIWRRP